MSKEPIRESQEETVSLPGMEIGKTARGEGGAAGGELEIDHQNIDNGKFWKILNQKSE